MLAGAEKDRCLATRSFPKTRPHVKPETSFLVTGAAVLWSRDPSSAGFRPEEEPCAKLVLSPPACCAGPARGGARARPQPGRRARHGCFPGPVLVGTAPAGPPVHARQAGARPMRGARAH